MAKEMRNSSKYDFAGLPIYDIIGKPLVAVARAQSMMAREQLRSLLETCFYFNGICYEPIMLKMMVTRSVLEPSDIPGGTPGITHVTTTFYLPMITIFPINMLGVENVDIDFNIEVTAHYETDTQEEEIEGTPGDWVQARPKTELKAKISSLNTPVSEGGTEQSHGKEHSSAFHINVEAGSIPLTKGLLEIIDIYSKSIHLDDLKSKDREVLKK